YCRIHQPRLVGLGPVPLSQLALTGSAAYGTRGVPVADSVRAPRLQPGNLAEADSVELPPGRCGRQVPVVTRRALAVVDPPRLRGIGRALGRHVLFSFRHQALPDRWAGGFQSKVRCRPRWGEPSAADAAASTRRLWTLSGSWESVPCAVISSSIVRNGVTSPPSRRHSATGTPAVRAMCRPS